MGEIKKRQYVSLEYFFEKLHGRQKFILYDIPNAPVIRG